MNHTKEPWEAKADPSYYGIVSEIYAMEKFVASLGGVCSPDEVEANARRIVACVNACAGITKEALEKGVITFALDWILKHDILDVFDPNMPREKEIPKEEATFMGVMIWDPKS